MPNESSPIGASGQAADFTDAASPRKGRPSWRDLGPTGHIDSFARDNLPPRELWPDFLLDRPEFCYPDYI